MHAAIATNAAWLTSVVLLSLRLSAVFLMTPLLGAAAVPVTIRVLLVLALAAVLSLGLPGGELSVALGGDVALVEAAVTELALGATLGLGILVAFAAFSMAGELLGIQIGFGLGQAIDPASSEAVPVLASAYAQVGVVAFFSLEGHHALLRGIAYSLDRFPLGRPWPIDRGAGPVLEQVGSLLSLGFALAAPVVVALLLVEIALGAIARNLPQVNMLVMGIPVKVVVGLLVLSLWIAGAGDVMTRVYGSIFRSWDALFPAGAAADTHPPDAAVLSRTRAAAGRAC